MKEYKKLDSIESEDIEKVREFAELMNELISLNTRRDYLQELISENEDLRGLVWTTREGLAKAITDLEDDHLKNIVPHLARQGATNTRIRKEYQKRFGDLPTLPAPVEDDDAYLEF